MVHSPVSEVPAWGDGGGPGEAAPARRSFHLQAGAARTALSPTVCSNLGGAAYVSRGPGSGLHAGRQALAPLGSSCAKS